MLPIKAGDLCIHRSPPLPFSKHAVLIMQSCLLLCVCVSLGEQTIDQAIKHNHLVRGAVRSLEGCEGHGRGVEWVLKGGGVEEVLKCGRLKGS